ncbi:hypothetical protein MOQ_008063, partial [Trypanosoma cruzi marinkellei]
MNFPEDRRGARRLVGAAALEWPKGFGRQWSPRRRVLRFRLVDTRGFFDQPARRALVLETAGPLRNPHARPFLNDWSARVKTSGVRLIHWTEETPPPPIGRDDVDLLLVILRGGAVETPGGGSGGGRGRPASSASEGQHRRHEGLLVIRRARAILPKSGQESHRSCAQSRDSLPDVWLDTRNGFFVTSTSAWRAVCAPSSSSRTSFQYDPMDGGEELHVPDWDAPLRERTCSR